MELDKDLLARQEARALLRQAEEAQRQLAQYSQQQLDAIVKAICEAVYAASAELAQLAVSETGFGNTQDKIAKNQFASRTLWDAIRDMPTVGVLKEDPVEKLWEVAVPVGVIAAIVPSTNPTSTVCYKAMIALKAGCAIVFSPHPKAMACTSRAARLAAEAAEKAGAPKGSIGCLTIPSMDGCKELMSGRETDLILATGGPAMVRAAYSSGKPAIGVGAGNGPAYIHHSADVDAALGHIKASKTFDHGTVCASEQSIVVEKTLAETVVTKAKAMGFYFMEEEEAGKLAKLLFKPNGGLNPAVVGRAATTLAEMAGFSVPRDTAVLVARQQQVGAAHPYSMEKLCPVLAFFVEENEDAVLDKVVQVLRHEGSGHTFVIHATDEGVIRKFALQVPVSRFLVNTPGALGGIGKTTGLFPALTLGCGAVGGSSSSNNISPLDLLNIRRVAWGSESKDPDLVELLTQKILEKLR